jgi:hypothetical protein
LLWRALRLVVLIILSRGGGGFALFLLSFCFGSLFWQSLWSEYIYPWFACLLVGLG